MFNFSPDAIADHLVRSVETQLSTMEAAVDRRRPLPHGAILDDMRIVLQTVYALTDEADLRCSADIKRRIGLALDQAGSPGEDMHIAVWTFADSVRTLLRRHGPLTGADIPY